MLEHQIGYMCSKKSERWAQFLKKNKFHAKNISLYIPRIISVIFEYCSHCFSLHQYVGVLRRPFLPLPQLETQQYRQWDNSLSMWRNKSWTISVGFQHLLCILKDRAKPLNSINNQLVWSAWRRLAICNDAQRWNLGYTGVEMYNVQAAFLHWSGAGT